MLIANSDQAMSVIRDAMFEHDIHLLSIRTGVSKSALYSIQRGKTKWPRGDTLFPLCVVLGLQFHLMKATKP